ncbi:DUF896 domain-containing protein [Paenibacillus rigui]|uniref:UPF0291 protein CF651_07395 n=1 Tax=Paenibacillus rigui TaxID=554312 RepID=A0A229UVP9_9BACL|nr:DUF896 domain-containing protein [Paenibacillus rigui]OXM86959.1 DUF896 family protein [Paenibacillus rigui]
MIPILNRINQLSRKAKETGLTEIETREQTELRNEYLQIFRGSIQSTLLNVTIYDPHGADVTPEKLRQEQAKLDRP